METKRCLFCNGSCHGNVREKEVEVPCCLDCYEKGKIDEKKLQEYVAQQLKEKEKKK